MLARRATCFLRCNAVKTVSKTTTTIFNGTLSSSTSNQGNRYFSACKYRQNESAPWYLNPDASPSVESPLQEVQLPALPANAPQTLENLINYLAKDLGIQDLKIFDMRDRDGLSLDSEGAYDISDFMILGTGKSAKHLLKASSELEYYIKHNLHKLPITEGVLKAGKLAKYHRRLHKKGKTAPNYSKENYGVTPNTWVMTDTKTDGIIIHMLTEERRRDLNLEYLWSPESERGQYSRSNYESDSDDIFRGIRYFHTSRTVRSQSSFDPFDVTFANYADEFRRLMRCHLVDHTETPLESLKTHLQKMYTAGLPLDYSLTKDYIETVFQSSESIKKFEKSGNGAIINHNRNFVAHLLEKYRIPLTRDEIKDLVPILVVGFSAFTCDSFLTLKKILNTYNIQQEYTFEHSKTLKPLAKLTTKLTKTTVPEERLIKHNTDVLLLTVFANGNDWHNFFYILDEAIARNDTALISVALPLVSVCADSVYATKFENDYLPLVSSSLPESLTRFTDELYIKTHST